MEQYLPGVLARELYHHWQSAAFEAQAVAARSFACHEIMHYATRRHYDVTDTQQSQAYIGEVNVAKALNAVARTAGQMLGYHGMLVPGYYCSCCGGTAASADAAIGDNPVNLLPPLAGRLQPDVCQDAPLYRWSIKRDRMETSRRITAFAQQQKLNDVSNISAVDSIEPVMSSPSGRPILYRIIDHRGDAAEIGAEKLRSAVNYRVADLPDFDRSLPSSHVDVRLENGSIIFDGRGFGHGVGMCQYGAQALALQQTGYLDILRWYYPSVEIVQAYESARLETTGIG
jgi:stage II sporulation protein D